jgi:Lar family restriction alleviation protein
MTIKERVDLKRCPFCGGTASLFFNHPDKYWYVGCLPCDAEGHPSEDKVTAVDSWNSRFSPEPRWKPPPNTPEEFALLRKCFTAVEYMDNGDPLKDAMDRDDIEAAIRLLLKFDQQLTDMVCGGPLGGSPETKTDECQHDLQKPDNTIFVIDAHKAKCAVCYNFFDLPLNGAER